MAMQLYAAIGTTLVTMAVCWLLFVRVGPKVLRAFSPAYEGLDFNKRVLMNETFVSLCHGAVVGTLASYVFAFDENIRPDKPLLYSALEHHVRAIFLGYSLSDVLVMLQHPDITEPVFLFHHVMSIYIGLSGLVYPQCAWYGAVAMMMELSNPFVNMRALLDGLGFRKSRAYLINGVAMLVVFFLCRILPVPIYWYHVAQLVSTGQLWEVHPLMIIGITVSAATYHVLNVIWFRKICLGAAKVLMTKNE